MPDELTTKALNAPSVSVLLVHNPFEPARSLERRTLEYYPTRSVAEYLTIIAPTGEYCLSVNGGAVPECEYANTFLEPGDEIVLFPDVTGGDGRSKGVIGIVITVLIMIVAAITQQWYTVVVAAISLVGQIVAVATYTPPPKLPDVSGFGDTSATYGWDGPKTLAMQGIPIPILYGTYKVAGNVTLPLELLE